MGYNNLKVNWHIKALLVQYCMINGYLDGINVLNITLNFKTKQSNQE